MRAILFTLISVLAFQYSFCQSQPKIENYPFGSLDVNIMVMPFGMEKPVKIGTMSKTGEMQFNFPKEVVVPQEEKENLSSELWMNLFAKCDKGSEMVDVQDDIFSFKPGFISLWTAENRYVGVVFPVSDKKLVPWIEDPGYNNAEQGTYYELVYVARAFQYQGDCISTETTEKGDVKVVYSYQLDLKPGFNFLKFQIESIHKTNPNERASFPDKISVSNTESVPDTQWIGKYF
jgi:hypothetical protein